MLTLWRGWCQIGILKLMALQESFTLSETVRQSSKTVTKRLFTRMKMVAEYLTPPMESLPMMNSDRIALCTFSESDGGALQLKW